MTKERKAAERLLLRLLGMLLAFAVIRWILPEIWDKLSPFIIAIPLAAALQPVIRFLQKKIKLKRSPASLIPVLLLLFIFLGLLIWLFTFGIGQVTRIVNHSPDFLTDSINSVQTAFNNLLASVGQSTSPGVEQWIRNAVSGAVERLSEWGTGAAERLVAADLGAVYDQRAVVFHSAAVAADGKRIVVVYELCARGERQRTALVYTDERRGARERGRNEARIAVRDCEGMPVDGHGAVFTRDHKADAGGNRDQRPVRIAGHVVTGELLPRVGLRIADDLHGAARVVKHVVIVIIGIVEDEGTGQRYVVYHVNGGTGQRAQQLIRLLQRFYRGPGRFAVSAVVAVDAVHVDAGVQLQLKDLRILFVIIDHVNYGHFIGQRPMVLFRISGDGE